jgi:peptidoglycan/xylan/chitin deacetylase (PgdA/CDA1 family)
MFRLPLSLMSPAGPRARLSILIFHRVLPRPDPLFPDVPDARVFEDWMRWVRDWFHVLPLDEAVDRLADGRLPARAMAITFDDGYEDNVSVAAPILQRLGLSATFFIATGYLGDGLMWNDRVIESVRASRLDALDLREAGGERHPLGDAAQRRAAIDAILRRIKHLPPAEREAATLALQGQCGVSAMPRLMMAREQMRDLLAMGMQLGGHTVSHPILTRLSEDEARREIVQGREAIEAATGTRLRLFAYPNGVPDQDYAAVHARLVREAGFDAAVSTAWGAARAGSDRFQLPRFTPWDHARWRWGVRLVDNLRRTERRAA